ncbi:manganese-dependent inorganic pyrophosphatase [Aerococcus kribbianus]|uniref:inorganic diphosphatase n=1 Tax=Aerococcus kribbianus TaxID=2999064 RepID=A0A9X3FV48_9LACT|nr:MULTISPECIES: manganese-dependent inorganic pyrophosphatase [unclassified Aerococcus]MCZ0716804.1 manganese-dependent inorganic pyrophosphatase [Aerococcus sp. YH-aer221]MCZ0725092.1 manganese-dependent inorganic pyrophosphatase [Aerococcus sp. YH-aer222]
MSKILVFGHKNPDTDAITSAIAYAYYLEQKGEEAEAVALGEVNEETQFALDKFGYQAPRVVDKVANETDTVALVDHNEAQQSVDDRDLVSIHSVVDHHRIANFETADPIFYLARPYGCSQTIIYSLFQEADIAIPENLAGLMLSAIISDTLLFKSPTTTAADEKVGQALAEIAGVDLQAYGLELLKSGTNVADKSAEEIADGDAKSFEMGNHTIRIGQINVVEVSDVLDRKEEILAEMQRLSVDNDYEAFLLIVTNILSNDSEGLVVGKEDLVPAFQTAFNGQVTDKQIALPGVVSRKKQVVPSLTTEIESL